MKKALSLILALIMVFALATTAFAAETVKHVVGDQSTGTGLLPGEFTEAAPNATVNINVSAVGTVHKYAVDVSWDNTPIALGGGKMEWNVKTMTYDTTGLTTGTDPIYWNITVTNYSDLPVYAYADIADNLTDDHMAITSSATNASRLTVDRATAGVNGANGKATEKTIVITLAPETDMDWADVVEYYTINYPGQESVTAGTATVHVAKDPS